jgi:hypothetical protein
MDAVDSWFQIVLADEEILKGARVIDVVNLLLEVVPADVAVLVGLEWSGYEVDPLQGKGGTAVVVTPEELARRIGPFVRFNWGTFFFTTQERLRSRPIAADQPAVHSLANALFAVRCVDGHLLFVYTQDVRHREVLSEHFVVAEAKVHPLSELVFPY